eukprot:1157972-Pelagomonas_calceolata.AAC.3
MMGTALPPNLDRDQQTRLQRGGREWVENSQLSLPACPHCGAGAPVYSVWQDQVFNALHTAKFQDNNKASPTVYNQSKLCKPKERNLCQEQPLSPSSSHCLSF